MARLKNADVLAAIKDVFENIEGVDEDVKAAVIKYTETQIASIEKKMEREKIRNANKKPKEDELLPIVKSVMTTEYQELLDIMAALKDKGVEVSRQKVSSRLGKLIAAGEAEKEITRSQGHMCTRYHLI